MASFSFLHAADLHLGSPLHGLRRRAGEGAGSRTLRVTFTGNYALYYQHDDLHLILVRVLHGARDIDALAGHGGLSGQ